MARRFGRLIDLCWHSGYQGSEGGLVVSQTEIVVLGAGIVGLCSALQLQRQGFEVTLIDRHSGPGRETSHGNAGLIQPDGFPPILFPRDWKTFASYATNQRNDCVYQFSALWKLAPALFKYWQMSRTSSAERIVAANLPLFTSCVEDHMEIAKEAGVKDSFRSSGWTRVFRNESNFEAYSKKIRALAGYGVNAEVLSPSELQELEPGVQIIAAGAVRLTDQLSLASPLKLSKAYFDLFLKNGGRFEVGDARTLVMKGPFQYAVRTERQNIESKHVVVCMGPWSGDLLKHFGIHLPMFVKRGYHIHFSTTDNVGLRHPTSDADGGYSLTPMDDGIRLNTGVEFAGRDSPSSNIQLARVIPLAREFFPLGDQREARPWVGSRPCLPDMLPLIGPSPKHPGLWFSFGHAHHGLTLAASTGRLLAEMMKGVTPFTDPTPYNLARFQ